MHCFIHDTISHRKIASCEAWLIVSAFTAVCLNKIYLYYLSFFSFSFGTDKLSPERTCIFFVVLCFFCLHFVFRPKNIYDFIYRQRFKLALVVFALCVALQLHGSSIGMLNNYFASSEAPSRYQYAILGIPRPIRSDEWVVSTSLALSQDFNGYNICNSISCAWPTNMLTTYNQPVWDITAIAKPFYWGYLLFGSSVGLSWFWCGRLIALFVVTFEMFMLISGKKKLFSVAAAFFISFAPVVQWWFAVNFFVEMLVYGQLAVLMLYHFLNAKTRVRKLLCTVVFTVCALGYLFALYPAWMVPLFYVFLALAIWVLTENFRKSPRSLKELVYLLWFMLMFAAVALSWFDKSKEAIAATMNTVYPGERFYTGGNGWSHLLFYINDLLLPYTSVQNSCESAMAYGFFPFTEIIVLIYLLKSKKKDMLLTFLLGIDAFFIFYLCVGVPEFIAKISLLYLSSARLTPIICIVEIIMYIRLMSLSDGAMFTRKKHNAAALALLFCLAVAFVMLGNKKIPAALSPESGLKVWYLAFTVVLISNFCLMHFIQRSGQIKKIFALSAIALSLLSSAFVNPIMRGLDAIYDKPMSAAVRTIQKTDPGIWISTDWIKSNFLIANGAPTISSTNIIPTMDRWKMFDADGKYSEVYNRYAHVIVDFEEDETWFESALSPDQFKMHISMEDLEKLGTKYIHTSANYSFPNEQFRQALTEIYNDGMDVIYTINVQ